MKQFLHHLEKALCATGLLFFTGTLLYALILLGYRYLIYGLIGISIPELSGLTIESYLHLTRQTDAATLLILAVFLMGVLLLTSFSEKIQAAVSWLTVFVTALFFLLSVEFFKSYQTSFQKSFIGQEHFTGIGDVIRSGFAQLSPQLFRHLAVAGALIAMAHLAVFFARKVLYGSSFLKRFSSALIPLPLVFTVAALLFPVSGTENIRVTALLGGDTYEKARAEAALREVRINPAYNLITEWDFRRSFKTMAGLDPGFRFRFKTDSLESETVHPRRHVIPRGKKYNVVLYFFESFPMKYFHLKENGELVVPNWHRLKKNSIFFPKHYANNPLSANALLSVLASSYDYHTKDLVIQKHPKIKMLTVSEVLKQEGYRTCLIHTGHLGYAGQLEFIRDRGFDTIIDSWLLIQEPPFNDYVGWGVDERTMIEPAARFIKKDMSRPFFMVCMPANPHHPYCIPDEELFKLVREIPEGAKIHEENWLNYINSLYYADHVLGMLVDRLESEDLLDETLIFLFSDHGEAFYQHRGNFNHPLFLYEENVHVPFLIYNRKLFQNTLQYDGISSHLDIFPTILDIIGREPVPEHEGTSLLSAHRDRLVLLHTAWKDRYMGVRDSRWKYIYRPGDSLEELYDLGNDPDEKQNLAPANREITARYREIVEKNMRYRSEYYRRILDRR